MSQLNKRMSVPGGTKYHRVQTFLVIDVTIALVTSCWTRAFPSLAPAVPHGQELAAIFPGLITPPPTRKAGFLMTSKKKRSLLTSCREGESRHLSERRGCLLRGAEPRSTG